MSAAHRGPSPTVGRPELVGDVPHGLRHLHPARLRTVHRLALSLAFALGTVGPAWTAPTLRVGVHDHPPAVLLAPDGEARGLWIDWLQAFAQTQGLTLQAVRCPGASACLKLLQEGRLDAVPAVTAAGLSGAPRLRLVGQDALLGWSQLFQRPATPPIDWQGLQGRRVASVADDPARVALDRLLQQAGVGVDWVSVSDTDKALLAVREGRADLALADHLFGEWKARAHGLQATGLLLNPHASGLAVRAEEGPTWLGAFERWLADGKARSDSDYHRMLRRWAAPPPAATPVNSGWGLALALATGLLAGIALLLTWRMRRRLKRELSALQASDRQLNVLLDGVDVALYVKGLDGRYLYANRRAADAMGRPVAEVVGQSDATLFDAETAAALRLGDERVLKMGEPWRGEERRRGRGAGEERFLQVSRLPLRDAEGRIVAVCGTWTDITEQRRALEAAQRLAFYDTLTALPNRSLVMDQLHKLQATCRRSGRHGALVLFDLDRFTTINETLGHAGGDRLLVEVARRLAAQVRASDTLARWGGDVFVLLLADLAANPAEAAQQALAATRKLQATLGAADWPLPPGLRLGATAGVALFSGASASPDAPVQAADAAVREAKKEGRGLIRLHDVALQRQAEAASGLQQDLKRAIQQGGLVLQYQPQVDDLGTFCGAEALVRWPHPERGMLPPDEFLRLAEQSGLIVPLGEWVLREVCRQSMAWVLQRPASGWRLAVNVSARQFHDPGFADLVLRVLRETGADANRLELELTEPILLQDAEGATRTMQRLRQAGLSFALDDFGMGFSSLGLLKRLPLTRLKIDRSFVAQLDAGPEQQAVVRAILAVADNLKVGIIAEGVETPSQRDRLIQWGCRAFQGYFFARPMTAAQLESQWLERV